MTPKITIPLPPAAGTADAQRPPGVRTTFERGRPPYLPRDAHAKSAVVAENHRAPRRDHRAPRGRAPAACALSPVASPVALRRSRDPVPSVRHGSPLERIVQEGPAGIHWIPGASHMPAVSAVDPRRREALLDGLTALERVHDFLLIDTPAGIGGGVLHLARQADELLLVTTPEPPAMMDAYALLKAARAGADEPIGPVRLIVNMVTHRQDARRVHDRLSETAGRFLGIEIGLLGHVFCDGHVGRAVQRREPLMLAYPHSQASWCVKQVAGAILEGSDGAGQGRFAFFRRLANLLGGPSR